MKKLLLIINPCAGTKQARKFLPEIIVLFSRYGYSSTVFITNKRGDATEFAKQYGKEVDLIVCIGGDGTLNEVVSGILAEGITTPLGFIPAGSTNDFANSLGLSNDIMTAAKDIMVGKRRAIDAGRFNDKYFCYVASFGAFTRASYSTPQNVKNALGHLAYILEGIKDLPSIHAEHIRLVTNEKIYEGDYIFGAVSNSTSLGGILTLDPKVVDMNDGMFELVLIKMPSTLLELQSILHALRNQQYDCNLLDFIKTDRAEILSDSQLNWSLDGELEHGSKAIEVQNIRSAINFVTNE